MDSHAPVLLDEVLTLLNPAGDDWIVDCTLGLGGHSQAMLEAAGADAHLIGLDTDEANVLRAKDNLGPLAKQGRFFHANFSSLPDVLEAIDRPAVDVILADLGFCSNQMDTPERGLSFQADGPLDMRLDTSEGPTAADIVNTTDETDLANLIYEFGEERLSRRIARRIVEARADGAIETTAALAEIVRKAYPPAVRHKSRIDPATRTFQALRIAVNDELGVLDELLAMLPEILAPGGRCGIISFHSLEDRRVKHRFRDLRETHQVELLTKKPIIATPEEIERNPRSRSAKLRGIQKRD
ncbi:MAG: 16S rRNA (cytosine(1402)-N(4))-methyltransferase RsmH [Phycisphaerales bacterium]|jgi:16S rRNA (cytosine1402-N4)-methyltransferase|nr:16S rRNA (cytosine(1402)-N(4))-methyltransferase RsmH [Phycisphaerales bacterium]MBT7170975.1 16S rRNA (cytosine(1402)-N(4))-methyltransferase RsmH [Phycisphaerales bacterium]